MLNRRQILGALLPALALGGPTRLHIKDSILQVDFAPGDLDLSRDRILRWVTKAASAVTRYYGRFPVALAHITVHPAGGQDGVSHGTTWGSVPPFTRISVGEHTTEEQLDQDWMMTHELVHMAFPDLAREHHWIEEGIATYVEPIARAMIGDLTPASIWRDMLKSMPLGEPGPLDHGLDRTHTWARTYWGGALFCLTADVRIREVTANRKGLRDGLRAILQAGGTIDHEWPITKAFTIADSATHTQVLTAMYSEMANKAVPVDLKELWMRLGVLNVSGDIRFNDNASLAAIRRSIISPAD